LRLALLINRVGGLSGILGLLQFGFSLELGLLLKLILLPLLLQLLEFSLLLLQLLP
jgi:hypothetical protein